jgi:dienelactone hydrolase
VREYRLMVGDVPTRVYEPAGAKGLVLLGHNGTWSKDHPRFVMLGRHYAAETGLAVVCVDAFAHGERVAIGLDEQATLAAQDEVVVGSTDRFVTDWQAAVGQLGSIGPPLAYVGFSMGAMMGLTVVGALPTIRAAVFGVAGVPTFAAADNRPPGSTVPHLRAAAALPQDLQVLMVNVIRDDNYRPQDVVELFSALAPRAKRLMFWDGEHSDLPDAMLEASSRFLKRYAVP